MQGYYHLIKHLSTLDGWKKQNEHNFQQVCHSTERARNQTNLWPCLLRWSRNLLVRKMVPATLQTIVATMKTTKSPTWYVTNDWWTFILLVAPPLSVPLTIIFFVAQSCLPEKERKKGRKILWAHFLQETKLSMDVKKQTNKLFLVHILFKKADAVSQTKCENHPN